MYLYYIYIYIYIYYCIYCEKTYTYILLCVCNSRYIYVCVYYCIQYLSQIWNLQPFGLQNRHAHEAKHVASGIIVHEKEIGGLCPKKEDAMMLSQYVRKKYQMEPTLIPEKRLFLHQGRKVLLPWMSSDTSFGDLTRGSPRHVLAAVEAVEATASRHAAKRLSKVSVLSAPTASRSACLPFSNTPALSVAEGCQERPRHVAQSAPAKVRQIECIWGQPLQQLHLLEKTQIQYEGQWKLKEVLLVLTSSVMLSGF